MANGGKDWEESATFLIFGQDGCAGSGGGSADIDDGGTFGDHGCGSGGGTFFISILSSIEEGIGGNIKDSHDQWFGNGD